MANFHDTRFSPLALALALTVLSPFSIAATRLPLEAFATLPVVKTAELSPDGQKVAMMVNHEGTTSIMVQGLGKDGKRVSLMSTDNKQYGFKWLQWVGNDRLLVATQFAAKRRMGNVAGGVGGTDTDETRLLSAKVDGSQVINLMKPNSFKGDYQPQFQDDVIDVDVDGGKHVLIALADQLPSEQNKTYNPDKVVYSLDVETGTRTHVFGPRTNFHTWMVDRSHQVRLGIMQNRADIEIHACDPDGKNWRKLWAYKDGSRDSVQPLGFGMDPNQLFILADNGGRRAVFTVDLRDPQLNKTVKLADNRNLFGSVVYSSKSREPVGLGGGAAIVGNTAANYWDSGHKEWAATLDQALPNRYNPIYSTSADETRYIVHSTSPNTPPEFYLGDDKANSLGLLASAYPALTPQAISPRQQVTIKARDGANLNAYLTLPQDMEAKNLPAVLLLEGGPQYTFDGRFNLWAQFLANRGYAVLLLNSRGYFGYGDDVSDAVQWLVAQGTANPKRICAVGGNQGGYAAMMAAAKTPDLFRCAASYAGPSDLVELVRTRGYYQFGLDVTESRMGTQALEPEKLKAASPGFLAAQIKVPVLLVHGSNDRRVSIDQSERMNAALSAANVPHRFVKQESGDYLMNVYEHRLQFFRELEKFLAENLGTR